MGTFKYKFTQYGVPSHFLLQMLVEVETLIPEELKKLI